jgi:hypothetical protein
MPRQPKGHRKATSLYRREAVLKSLHGIFQKTYLKAEGTPQERFEKACQATDAEILKASQSEPSKKAFWILVVDDFKNHLLNLVENEKLIDDAIKATELVPGEVGTVNV